MARAHDARHFRVGVSAKLAICLVSAAIIGFAIFGEFHQRLEQRHLEALVSLSAERVSDVVHSSSYDAMLKNDRGRLYTLMRDLGNEPGIRLVRIINEDGLVVHSSDLSEVGTMVDKSAEACYACHAQQQPLTKLTRRDRARIFANGEGGRTLAVIRPIENRPECSNASCHAHPPSRRILGVIDAHLALTNVDAQLAEHRQQMTLFILISAVIACLLSIAFVWLVLHRPVRDLMTGTMTLAGGDFDYRLAVRSRDELGVLAASFNSMAERIKQSQQELKSWAETLEDRVQRKTGELEKAHRGLLMNEKMASLGRLAATVAHEVNNPLFGMLTYARLTMKDLDRLEDANGTKSRMQENLQIIERESKRCGDLMQNLLTFSRQKAPQLTPMRLNAVVDSAVRLIRHKLELNQIELELQLAANLPEITGDPNQIQQVLIVLIVNAAEAVGKSGTIRVTTGVWQEGSGVYVAVRDNGPGIPRSLQEQIFEPFFSTKESDHRTGLGLAVAKGIVERHGGTLTVQSEPGQGAEFLVHLPLLAPAALTDDVRGGES